MLPVCDPGLPTASTPTSSKAQQAETQQAQHAVGAELRDPERRGPGGDRVVNEHSAPGGLWALMEASSRQQSREEQSDQLRQGGEGTQGGFKEKVLHGTSRQNWSPHADRGWEGGSGPLPSKAQMFKKAG